MQCMKNGEAFTWTVHEGGIYSDNTTICYSFIFDHVHEEWGNTYLDNTTICYSYISDAMTIPEYIKYMSYPNDSI